jgi:hypothetical protein
MNKKFLQSIVVGIAALTLAASCSSLSKTESNTCSTKNGCAAKKDEVTKEETKEVKKAKKSKVAKSTETKTKEKSN